MLVSIVMPVFNGEKYLKEAIESILRQTYKNFELIVIDQNNELNIVDLIEKYQNDFDIKYNKSYELGLSLNRNKGLFMMDGDIVGFPDDDCEYEKDTLQKVINYFEGNKEKKIYSCRTLERGKDYGTGNMLERDTELTYSNVEDTVKSITFFVNFSIKKKLNIAF